MSRFHERTHYCTPNVEFQPTSWSILALWNYRLHTTDDLSYSIDMPRLKQIPRSEVESPVVEAMYQRLFDDRDPVAEPGTATGTPGDWWTVFAMVPDVMEHATRGFALYASPDRVIHPVLRELGQTRAGWLVGSQFVFSQHCKSCRALGMSEAKIEAIKIGAASDEFQPLERLVLAYTDCLVTGLGRVPEPLFEALKAELSDEAIFELTYITTMYSMHAIITRALRMEFDDRDDPVAEVPAPEGYVPRNLGRDISLDLRS